MFLPMAAAVLLPRAAFAAAPCSGHLLLPQPRAQGSCQDVKPRTFTSPDKKTVAAVLAVDKSLNDTPRYGEQCCD
jgi:hypothetical protein